MQKTADNDGARRRAGPAGRPPRWERALGLCVHACLALILLTPLVWSPEIPYPFSVGKAVYARSLIALLVVLWTPLALARTAWRPPRTALMGVLAAGLAVAALSAWLGVSPQRSLWSTYMRMEGLLASVHWMALFVVLAGTVRMAGGWTRLLNANLAVGLVVALVAVARYHIPELPLFGLPPEERYPRVSATTGNPTFLGGYMLVTALLAAGFLVRSLTRGAAKPAEGPKTRGGSAKKTKRARGRGRRGRPNGHEGPWRLFWAVTALAAVYALVLSASLGASVGLGAGAGAAAGLYAWLGASAGARRMGRRALVALGVLAVVLAAGIAIRASSRPATAPGAGPDPAFESLLLERATSAGRIGATLGRRAQNWESGLAAFAERPLLGWGPGNYFVGSARHRAAPEGPQLLRDHAHNMLIDEAVTKGVPGLAAYLALWAWTLLVLVRAARAAEPRDRALLIFAAAALFGWFVQTQSLFYSATNWLQQILLLGFAAHWEARIRGRVKSGGGTKRGDGRARTRRSFLGHPAARAVIPVLALAAAGASLAANRAVLAGASAIYHADDQGAFLTQMERAIDAFAPLANEPRLILINNVAFNWPVLSTRQEAEAERLLAWVNEEAPAALAAEPESWVVHHALARFYRAVAETEPEYAERGERHYARSLELAPNLDPLELPVMQRRAR